MSGGDKDSVRIRSFISKTEDPFLFHVFDTMPLGLRAKLLKRVLRATPLEAFGLSVNDLPPELRSEISHGAAKEKHQERMAAKESKPKASAAVTALQATESVSVAAATPPPEPAPTSTQPADDETPLFLLNGVGAFGSSYEGY